LSSVGLKIDFPSGIALRKAFSSLTKPKARRIALAGLKKIAQKQKKIQKARMLRYKNTGASANGLRVKKIKSNRGGYVGYRVAMPTRKYLLLREGIKYVGKKGYYPASQEYGWTHYKSNRYIQGRHTARRSFRSYYKIALKEATMVWLTKVDKELSKKNKGKALDFFF
jgi:hypothetical protein